jgi:hypothetical protein
MRVAYMTHQYLAQWRLLPSVAALHTRLSIFYVCDGDDDDDGVDDDDGRPCGLVIRVPGYRSSGP